MFRSRKILLFLPTCFFFHFFSILASTFTYTVPDQYFVNCGSGSSPEVYGKTFVGDGNHGGVSLSSGNNSPVQDASLSSTVELYQSARVFRKLSWYEFNVQQDGTFVVRFHFLPFSSLGNVSDARFSVVASGFSLLSRFTVEKSNSSPHIEEFLITITAGKFKVYFVPDGDNSFAFVNAIEVFIAPPGFIPGSAPLVTREGNRGDFYSNLLSFPSRLIHRINVGGKNIMPNNDTLLRSWIPDAPYLFNRESAKDSVYGFRPKYQNSGAGATVFDAPEFVYGTAKQMNIDNSSGYYLFNITWSFRVKGGAKHLVRVHFCDIVSDTSNEGLKFNLYIYNQFSEMIWPYDVIPQLAAPFYRDYQVDSDDSGFINVSVGPSSDSNVKNAFLNGVEIMQLIEDTGSVSEGGGGAHLFMIIGSVVGGVILLVVILIVVLVCLRRRKSKAVEAFDRPVVPFYGGSSYSRTTDNKTVVGSPLADLNLGLKLHLSEILYATKNFDTKLMIGEGGFGKVYKGMLRNGTKVAVKRSDPRSSDQGLPEFHTEIMVLSKIRHNHLVSLIGYCDEREEMILVYEFMEKGTFREHLYKIESSEVSTPRSTLSWDQRVRICVGAAKGIHYLHTGSSGVIIHRDIKSTNILLDEHFVAKVADFGLSRSGPLDQTHVSTEVKGSFGYLDPEYFKYLQLTQKSDVYSFGVVLLEALCARPVVDQFLPRDKVSLVDWGMSQIKKGQLEQIVDPLLEGKINPDSLRKFGETVEKCLQEYGADRPNMVDVLWDLEYCLQLHHTVAPRMPYEDSMTDVGLPMPVIQRLPSHTLASDEDESNSYIDSSQVDAGEVFSLLKTGEAR
ncbi:putative receptor-like protein kinase [Dorcoceras hygrometricum]|uniref:Putative receptor-like protein kinase n=1 Tax=Dorcoceras hygrometricum TaxID=472368 RepID=A0A2Z7CAC3_9LAMI|nr:putative receptor-like protein kinase [Dorcoceras hygrometricum]